MTAFSGPCRHALHRRQAPDPDRRMRNRNIAQAWRVCRTLLLGLKDNSMNKDRLKGAAREVRGKIKEATGKATGNSTLEAKGFAQKVAGKARNTTGKEKDAARKP